MPPSALSRALIRGTAVHLDSRMRVHGTYCHEDTCSDVAVPLAVRYKTDVGTARDVTMQEIIIKYPSISHGTCNQNHIKALKWPIFI